MEEGMERIKRGIYETKRLNVSPKVNIKRSMI